MSAPVLLATCQALPQGEYGGQLLVEACARRGLDARWVVWDDPAEDWAAGLVCVRATWDYDGRRAQFLDWAGSVPWLLNSAAVFAWNTDKAYLVELAGAGVPVVPTVSVDARDELAGALARFDDAVVKPRVGAGGRGVTVVASGAVDDSLGPGPWVVQPLVESVRTEGEYSVYVLGGEVVSLACKRPGPGEIRVHEEYGGHTVAGPVTDETADLARRTVAGAERLLGCPLDYARVDQMRLADGTLAVSELEVTEPGLYLDVLPGNADAFAALVASRATAG